MGFLSKKALFIILSVLVLGGVVGGFWYYRVKSSTDLPERASIENAGDVAVAAYDRAAEFYVKIQENPSEGNNYVVVGNELRRLGAITGDKTWDKLSYKIYEQGVAATEYKSALLLSNTAQIAADLGDYKSAQTYFQSAIDLTPGDAALHVAHIQFMRYKLKSSETEILDAYSSAIDRVVGGADLIASRMAYLRDIGRYAAAREDLKLLLNNKIITEQTYASELSDIANLESNQ